MALRINDTAPDFTAQTTQGPIDFHQWVGDKWAILFSHPKDFTPVCTTELGYMAKIEPEFAKRGVKLIGLSVDPSEAHARWLDDIEETQGAKVNYPIIADHDLKVAKLYEMLPAEEPGTSEGRTAATNQTVRTVYVIGPDKKIKLLRLSNDHGPQLRRDSAGDRFDAAHRQAQGRHASELEARRRRHHRRLSVGRRRQEDVPGGMAVAEALYPHR
jgi:alkyl hydroperoxide reductase subunit AhpC